MSSSQAHGILRLGLYARREFVARAGRTATLLACGCVPLLIIAGTLEGFVSPSGLPGGVKFLIGLCTGVLLYSYLCFCARTAEESEAEIARPAEMDPGIDTQDVAPRTRHYQGGSNERAVG